MGIRDHVWAYVTTSDGYAQGMVVPWHGSIAPVRLEVPAAGAYRQVHCSLSTSLFTLYCNVLFCTVLYCTDVGNYLQIKSSNHNSHIGPNLLISAEKKAFRTQLSSCPSESHSASRHGAEQTGFRYQDQRNCYVATSHGAIPCLAFI